MEKKKNSARREWLGFALLLGMLIWVRLRLVTDIPRAAFAEPVEGLNAAPAELPRAAADEADHAEERVETSVAEATGRLD